MLLHINIQNTFWQKGFQTFKNTFPQNLYCLIFFILIPHALIDFSFNLYSVNLVLVLRQITQSSNISLQNILLFIYQYLGYFMVFNLILFLFYFLGYFSLIQLSSDFLSARPLRSLGQLFKDSIKKILSFSFLIIIALTVLFFVCLLIFPVALFLFFPFLMSPVLYIMEGKRGVLLIKDTFFFEYLPLKHNSFYLSVYFNLLTIGTLFVVIFMGSYFILYSSFDLQYFFILNIPYISEVKIFNLNILYLALNIIKIFLQALAIGLISILSTSLYFWINALRIRTNFHNQKKEIYI